MSITRQNLSVIIVSYKSDYVIENCIDSIDSEIEIIVIDNSGNDQLKEKIESKYKNVKCILSKENLGMGAGNNLGIKNVNKDYVLILNPDVILEKSSIDEMIQSSKEIDNFGVIAPLSDKNEYPNYTLKKVHNFNSTKPFKVKSVDGYAMLLNLKKLKKLEDFYFFDENFFLYLENEDLCKRLEKNNEDIYIIPNFSISFDARIISSIKLFSKVTSGFNINTKSLFTFLIPKLFPPPMPRFSFDKIHLTFLYLVSIFSFNL